MARSERVLAGNNLGRAMPLPSGRSQLWAFPSLASRPGVPLMLSIGTRSLIPDLGTQLLFSLGSPICLFLTPESIEWGLSYCVHGCCKNWRVISVKHPVSGSISLL